MCSEHLCANFKAKTVPNVHLGLLANMTTVTDESIYESWYDWSVSGRK